LKSGVGTTALYRHFETGNGNGLHFKVGFASHSSKVPKFKLGSEFAPPDMIYCNEDKQVVFELLVSQSMIALGFFKREKNQETH